MREVFLNLAIYQETREVIIQEDRIMNYQLARPIEFRDIRIIRIGPTI